MTKDGAWRSGCVGTCLKPRCANRDKKCRDCYKINGKETEYLPEEGAGDVSNNG